MADAKKFTALPAEVKTALAETDALTNNAGIIQPLEMVNDRTMDQINYVVDANFDGSFTLIKTFLLGLLKRPEARILTISCIGDYAPVPRHSIYVASKASIKLLTKKFRGSTKCRLVLGSKNGEFRG